MSVATWSLRLRAVCSFAAAGTSLVSACSMFMWTSSRDSLHSNSPASMRFKIFARPATICLHSAFVRMPTSASIFACAVEPSMSKRAKSLSKETDSLNLSIKSLGPSENLPPQLA